MDCQKVQKSLKKIKIILVFGTRPEAIKMAPLVIKMKQEECFDVKVILTAQHREMLDQVMQIFGITADYDLNIMKHAQTLYHTTTSVLNGVGEILQKEKPDLLLVHGDTTTTFAASLAGFYEKVKVGHVEAGLRSFDKQNPFPEEMNRLLTDSISDLYFAPTELSKRNILNENKKLENIFITGNTVIDALLHISKQNYEADILKKMNGEDFILATVHRRENWAEQLVKICNAFNEITTKNNIKLILPVHPNPNVKNVVYDILGNNKNIFLTEPFEYIDLVSILKKCKLVLTDSGGLQEEAPALGKPVLVLRKTTERPEAIEKGTAMLVGDSTAEIVNTATTLLTDSAEYEKMANAVNPYGDGKASERTIDAIKYHFNITTKRPNDFI
jgi:UDP-N-acetylglucosamine 2-epimerase (non-hydrolysing)